MSTPPEEFVSEPIVPERGTFDPGALARGLASLPASFTWRGTRYVIVECLGHEKLSSREGHTAHGELYLRRQRFRVRLDSGQLATIDFDRQARPGAPRWHLYTIAARPPHAGDRADEGPDAAEEA